jgi:alkaline phosphatase D
VTAPEPGAKSKVRFAFGSCAGKEPWLDAATWADIDARASVDLVLLLGDIHYANTTDVEKQRAAYIAHRMHAGYRALFSHTPLYAIWDDHDYGPNDSDGTLAGKEKSLKTFREFFANPGYGEPENPGIYFKFSRGGVDFFMLDGRFHRTPNKAPNDEAKTMLGAKQLEWLKRELLASKAAVRVIAAGSEWQSNSTNDCWTSFKHERAAIFAILREHEMKNVLLISGDRHFSAGYQVEGRFLEVTSGPLGSPNAPPKVTAEMFTLHDHGKMYCVYDIDTTATPAAVTLEIYETGVGLVEKRKFTWDEVAGDAKIAPLPADYKTPAMRGKAADAKPKPAKKAPAAANTQPDKK